MTGVSEVGDRDAGDRDVGDRGELTIRPYEQRDRDAVFRIAADTAAFGAPVEAFLDDRRLFCDAVYRYYLDYEPEHAWVATVHGPVAGFLTGCVDTRRRDRCYARRIIPSLVARLLKGRYHIGCRTLRYVIAEIGAALRGELSPVDLAAYPAHLHINVDAPARGQGTGRRLLEAYLRQLRELGVPGVHLRTASANTAAVILYERLGFRLLDARPTRAWMQVVRGPVENRVYGLKLP